MPLFNDVEGLFGLGGDEVYGIEFDTGLHGSGAILRQVRNPIDEHIVVDRLQQMRVETPPVWPFADPPIAPSRSTHERC